MQALEQQVRATEQALSLGFDSARFSPWAQRARSQLVDYPDMLLALNKITRQMRRLAYTVTLRWVETRQLLPLLHSRLPETWSVTPTQAATVVGEE